MVKASISLRLALLLYGINANERGGKEGQDVITVPLPPPIFPSSVSLDVTATVDQPTRQSSYTSSEASSLLTTTTHSAGSVVTIRPGAVCQSPVNAFFCFDSKTLARCINSIWRTLPCPRGQVCRSGECVREALPSVTYRSTTTVRVTMTTTATIISTVVRTRASSSSNHSTLSSPTIIAGKTCRMPDDLFVCVSDLEFARCVHSMWIVQSCAPGTVCSNGRCVWPLRARRNRESLAQDSAPLIPLCTQVVASSYDSI